MHNEDDIRRKCMQNIEQFVDEIDYMLRNTIHLETLTTEELMSFDNELGKLWWELIKKSKI